MERAALPGSWEWNDRQGPWGVVRGVFLSRVAAATGDAGGGYANGTVRSATDLDGLVPSGWDCLADFRPYDDRFLALAGPDGSYALLGFEAEMVQIQAEVYSPAGYADAATLRDAMLGLADPLELPEGGLEVCYWTTSAFGPRSYVRVLEGPTWAEAAPNYPADLRARLAAMHAWTSAPSGGRLLLGHGPVGTGKTSVVKTLAREWQPWCGVHYVVDPDEFFGDAAYMTGVLMGGEVEDRSRLIVVEDCDELLTVDAKRRSGQALARLLNVCDGLVGQGLKVLLYLTTNEPVDSFHPAIMRPGRCLDALLFDRFDATEADGWRKAHGLARTGADASLADLYGEERTARAAAVRRTAERLGQRLRLLGA